MIRKPHVTRLDGGKAMQLGHGYIEPLPIERKPSRLVAWVKGVFS